MSQFLAATASPKSLLNAVSCKIQISRACQTRRRCAELSLVPGSAIVTAAVTAACRHQLLAPLFLLPAAVTAACRHHLLAPLFLLPATATTMACYRSFYLPPSLLKHHQHRHSPMLHTRGSQSAVSPVSSLVTLSDSISRVSVLTGMPALMNPCFVLCLCLMYSLLALGLIPVPSGAMFSTSPFCPLPR